MKKNYKTNWYFNNREYYLNYAKNFQRKKIKSIRDKIFILLDSKCLACSFSDKRALQIDHINSGGCLEQKEFGTGLKYLNIVLNSILNDENKYQLLCANCNWIKRSEKKEHSGINSKKLDSQKIGFFDF